MFYTFNQAFRKRRQTNKTICINLQKDLHHKTKSDQWKKLLRVYKISLAATVGARATEAAGFCGVRKHDLIKVVWRRGVSAVHFESFVNESGNVIWIYFDFQLKLPSVSYHSAPTFFLITPRRSFW